MRRPAYRVDRGAVAPKLGDGEHGHADVEDDDFLLVHHDGGQIVRVLVVPGDPQQRALVAALVDDRRVLEVSQVEVPHRAVLPCRGEHAHVLREADVVDGLVVRDELGLNNLLLNVPNRARRVDARSAYHVHVLLVPVETCQRRAVLRLLCAVVILLDLR